jgi:hypothetical protein
MRDVSKGVTMTLATQEVMWIRSGFLKILKIKVHLLMQWH